MVGQWNGDGSSEIVVSPNSNEVECVMGSESSSGNTFNAVWKENEEGINSGSHYWKIHVSNLNPNSIFVGLTDMEKFKKGWGLKGLLYGGPGNLSNGSALVISGYGPHVKSENTVGVLAIFDNGKLKVYFDLNGEPLGQAFDLPETILKGAFPCVHFSGAGKATIVKSDDIPTNLNREEPAYSGIEGDWECLEFNGAKPGTNVTVAIFKDDERQDGFSVSLHVINRIHYVIHCESTGNWKASGGMSTLMAGPPELMTLESQMSNLFGNPSKVEVVDGNFLSVTSAGNTSKWERYSTAKSAVTQDPFH